MALFSAGRAAFPLSGREPLCAKRNSEELHYHGYQIKCDLCVRPYFISAAEHVDAAALRCQTIGIDGRGASHWRACARKRTKCFRTVSASSSSVLACAEDLKKSGRGIALPRGVDSVLEPEKYSYTVRNIRKYLSHPDFIKLVSCD